MISDVIVANKHHSDKYFVFRISTYDPDFHDKDVIAKMEYNKLGNTDMVVSKMTFGTELFLKCLYMFNFLKKILSLPNHAFLSEKLWCYLFLFGVINKSLHVFLFHGICQLS